MLLSPEAKNPAKHVPRALFASLVAVAIVCATASIALSGAAPAQELDSDSAFAEAFRDRGMKTAYKVRVRVWAEVSAISCFAFVARAVGERLSRGCAVAFFLSVVFCICLLCD